MVQYINRRGRLLAPKGPRVGGGGGAGPLLSSLLSPPMLQADAGAQVVQIFDSWASHLSPQDFDVFCAPYIKQIVDSVKQSHPNLPLILYNSGSGGLLERMTKCGTDIISVDQSVDLRDAIQRIGPNFAVQVNMGAATASVGGGDLAVRPCSALWGRPVLALPLRMPFRPEDGADLAVLVTSGWLAGHVENLHDSVGQSHLQVHTTDCGLTKGVACRVI